MNTWLPSGAGLSGRSAALPRLATFALPLAAAFLMGSLVVFTEANALVLCLALLAGVFVMRDFRIGVILLIVLMPVSASTLIPRSIGGITGLNPQNILLVGTLASYLLRGLPEGGLARFAPKPLVWLYVLPVVVAGVIGSRHLAEIPPYFFADNRLQFTLGSGYFPVMVVKPLFIVLFGLLVGAAAGATERPERLIYALLLSIWCMGLIAIVFVLLSGTSLAELAGSQSRKFFDPLGIHANALGRLYAIAYALLLFTFAATRDYRLRLALVATMGVIVLALLLTFSRSSFIGFALVNVLFLLSRRRLSLILVGGALFALVALLLPAAFYDRVSTGWGDGLNAISAGRVGDIWLPLLPELWDHPLFGNGTGAILWSRAMRAGSILAVDHPHNAYLQTLLNMGIVGTALIGAYYVHLWRGFRRLAADAALSPVLRGFYAGAGAGLISFLVAGISGSSLTPGIEQIFLWLAIGMMYGQRRQTPGAPSC